MDRMLQRAANLFFDCPDLRAFTKNEGGKEVKYLRGTASSTAKDFYGSVITAEAQVKMLNKLKGLADKMRSTKGGLTAFVNHSYKIPEDVLGCFTSAQLTTRTSDGVDGIAGGDAGIDYIDLDVEVRVIDSNERAVKAWEQVNEGIRHGFSIGAYFLDGYYGSEDPADPAYWDVYITDVELLEVSLVGIPANQRAWCRETPAELGGDAVAAAEKIARDKNLREHLKSMSGDRLANLRGLALRSIIHRDDETSLVQRGLAYDFRRLSAEPDDEATDEDRAALNAAADLLEKRSDAGDPTSPDDGRDMLTTAVGHLARAVGHGLCVRGAGHIARALDCLAIIGADGGTSGPGGDEDPSMQSLRDAIAELKKIAGNPGALSIVAEATDASTATSADVSAELAAAIGELLRVADTNTASPITRNAIATRDLVAFEEALKATRTRDLVGFINAINAAGIPNAETLAAKLGITATIPDAVKSAVDRAAAALTIREVMDGLEEDDKLKAALGVAHDALVHLDEIEDGLHADPAEELVTSIEMLSPKAGDLVVFRGMEAAALSVFIETVKERALFSNVTFMALPTDDTVTIEAQAAAAATALEETRAALATLAAEIDEATKKRDALLGSLTAMNSDVASRTAELETIVADIATKTAEHAAISKQLVDIAKERVGRVAAAQTLLERIVPMMGNAGTNATVTPEMYRQSPGEQRAALAKQASGDTTPPAGRDLAINAK